MKAHSARRASAVVVLALWSAIGLSACDLARQGSGSDGATKPGCRAFQRWQGDAGKAVSVYTTIRGSEGDLQQQSYEKFERCTGIKIKYEGSGEFEAQLPERIRAGNAPDLAYLPQPGLLKTIVRTGKVKLAPASVGRLVDKNWSPQWKDYGTIKGKFYAAPLSANVKSYVWYSPKEFKDKNYKIPQTWDQLIALSDKIAHHHKPWCAGMESAEATGWVATDWLEDVMLREAGPETYDKWVQHEIPFNSPVVMAAADRVAGILKNPAYVNGGFGGVDTITTTAWQEGGLPILERSCSLHRQASFYANHWVSGTRVAADGDVFAFYLPPIDTARGKPVLGGGDFVAAFADRAEVRAFQEYLATADWANERAKLGNWISANEGLDIANVTNPIDRLSVEILQDPEAIFRFDGSDLMPGTVGAGSFWRGMIEWINGSSTEDTLDFIERSWTTSGSSAASVN